MAYTKTNWVDGQTDVSADNMNHIENGIKDVQDRLGDNTIYYQDGNFYIRDKDGTKTKKLGSSEGTATTSQVLSGATFNSKYTSDSDDYSIGTMSDYSTNVQTVDTANNSSRDIVEYDIPDGFHTKIKVNQVSAWDGGFASGFRSSHAWQACSVGEGWVVTASNSFVMPIDGDVTWVGTVRDGNNGQCYTRLKVGGNYVANHQPGGDTHHVYSWSGRVAKGTTVVVEANAFGGYSASSTAIYQAN